MKKEEHFKDYSDLLDNINLLDISIREMDFKKNEIPGLKGSVKVRVSFNSLEPEYNQDDDILEIVQPLNFTMVKDSETEEIKMFELNVTYIMKYSLNKKITDDLFDEYAKSIVPKILHPYLREVISTSLGRAAMPAFTIPVYENS